MTEKDDTACAGGAEQREHVGVRRMRREHVETPFLDAQKIPRTAPKIAGHSHAFACPFTPSLFVFNTSPGKVAKSTALVVQMIHAVITIVEATEKGRLDEL